jgi:hypothetical protein
MHTDFENNEHNTNETEQRGGFTHGGWIYLVFFIGLVGILVAVSYIAKWFLG